MVVHVAEALRVVVGEDDVLLREGIARLLSESGCEVVAQAGDAEDLRELRRYMHRVLFRAEAALVIPDDVVLAFLWRRSPCQAIDCPDARQTAAPTPAFACIEHPHHTGPGKGSILAVCSTRARSGAHGGRGRDRWHSTTIRSPRWGCMPTCPPVRG
jgi:hypothetical protein